MSGGSQSARSKPTDETLQAQKSQYNASQPVLEMFSKMLMEAANTGTSSQIPVTQRAVEAGRNATAQSSASTKESLARGGVTGPYARQVQEGVEQQGAFDVSQIDPQMVMALLQQMADFGLMRGSPVWGGQSSKSSGTNWAIL